MGSIEDSIEKLKRLEKEYLKLHPKGVSPGVFPMWGYTFECLIDMYENANGRKIVWKDHRDPEVLDGGGYEYVDE